MTKKILRNFHDLTKTKIRPLFFKITIVLHIVILTTILTFNYSVEKSYSIAKQNNKHSKNRSKQKKVIWEISIKNIRNVETSLKCEVVSTSPLRRRGLMFRKKLGRNECMLFIFEELQILSFWMKNTLIPLSIAYLDESWTIREIFQMKAQDERLITSNDQVIYAIEVNRGWFRQHYIYHGAKIKIKKKQVIQE